jgi:methionyl aminopeptidase
VIVRKSAGEIAKIAAAGAILADCIDALTEAAAPGVTTAELDRIAEKFIRQHRGVPTFLGYRGFPASIARRRTTWWSTASPASTGRPRRPPQHRRGRHPRGYVADSTVTLPWARSSLRPAAAGRHARVARGRHRRCREAGARRHLARRAGGRGGGRIQRRALARGHGVGRRCTRPAGSRTTVTPAAVRGWKEGMVFAIEPMVDAGARGRRRRRRVGNPHNRRVTLGALRAHRRGGQEGA